MALTMQRGHRDFCVEIGVRRRRARSLMPPADKGSRDAILITSSVGIFLWVTGRLGNIVVLTQTPVDLGPAVRNLETMHQGPGRSTAVFYTRL